MAIENKLEYHSPSAFDFKKLETKTQGLKEIMTMDIRDVFKICKNKISKLLGTKEMRIEMDSETSDSYETAVGEDSTEDTKETIPTHSTYSSGGSAVLDLPTGRDKRRALEKSFNKKEQEGAITNNEGYLIEKKRIQFSRELLERSYQQDTATTDTVTAFPDGYSLDLDSMVPFDFEDRQGLEAFITRAKNHLTRNASERQRAYFDEQLKMIERFEGITKTVQDVSDLKVLGKYIHIMLAESVGARLEIESIPTPSEEEFAIFSKYESALPELMEYYNYSLVLPNPEDVAHIEVKTLKLNNY